MFIGRTDAKAETPILWPPHAKSWLIGKDPDWGQEEKGTTEEEMAGWHHWHDGHESEWTLGVGDGQGGLPCCDSWSCKESDTTERLNWTELNTYKVTEESHWRESLKGIQVGALSHISVLKTACSSARSCIPGTDKRQRILEKWHTKENASYWIP